MLISKRSGQSIVRWYTRNASGKISNGKKTGCCWIPYVLVHPPRIGDIEAFVRGSMRKGSDVEHKPIS